MQRKKQSMQRDLVSRSSGLLAGIVVASLSGAAAQAGTLYWAGGTTDIADGTAIPTTNTGLTGTWDLTTKNWCSDTNLLTYVAWSNGDDMVAALSPIALNTKATITLGANVVLNQVRAPSSVGGGTMVYSITATSAKTITLAGANPTLANPRDLQLQANVSLVAANGFTKTGSATSAGNVVVYSDNPSAVGKATINGGSSVGIKIEATGTLSGITEFDVMNGNTRLAEVMSNGANNRINDNAVVILRGGAFAFSGAGGTETMKQLAPRASGYIDIDDAGAATMTLAHPTAGIDRGVDGTATLFFTDTFISSLVVNNGVPTGVLLPWAATLSARPVQLNATTKAFEILSVTAAPADLSTWSADTRYRVEGAFTASGAIPTLSIASVGIKSTGATTLTIGSSDTLTITTGHLSMMPQTGDTGGRTITGGQLTSGTNALYLLTGTSGLAVQLNVNSALVGNMDVIKSGAPFVNFSGAGINTYTGTTYINRSTLFLLKTISEPDIPGNVVINASGNLTISSGMADRIKPTADITLREGGTLKQDNGTQQNYSGTVTFEGGTLTLGGSLNDYAKFNRTGTGLVFSNGGTLTQAYSGYTTALQLLTDVSYAAACTNQANLTTANSYLQYLDLTTAGTGPATRTFDVADAVGLASTTNEMVIDIPLRDAAGAPATLAKTGTGVLALERLTARFSGNANVTGGTLLINGPFATQTVQTATTVYNSTALSNLPTTNGLRVGQLITGTVIPANTVISAITGATTLTMSAKASANGTYSLTFGSSGALGTGSVVVATSGTLGGVGGVKGTVAVNAGGTLNPGSAATPKGVFTVVGTLDLSGGGTWQVDIDGDASNDQVQVLGDVALGGSAAINLLGEYDPPTGEWVIATYSGNASGSMSAPAGYKVSIDSGSKRILLGRSAGGTIILVR